jgi:hypothetical protein
MLEIPIDRATFEQKRRDLAQRGMALAGDEGTLEAQGCEVSFAYDGSMLRIQVLKKPAFFTEALVEGQIQRFFQ